MNAWIRARRTTDRDPASAIPEEKRKSVIFSILCRPFFYLMTTVTFISVFFFTY